jgi:hypothetical protein
MPLYPGNPGSLKKEEIFGDHFFFIIERWGIILIDY